jgi:hypothetical protein
MDHALSGGERRSPLSTTKVCFEEWMNTIATTLRYETWILLALLAVVVTYQLLTGTIKMRGLLRDKMGDRAFSPARLQLLIATAVGSLYYLMLVIGNEKPGEFPAVPRELLVALGGSHALYLGGKLSSLLKLAFGLSSARNKRQT